MVVSLYYHIQRSQILGWHPYPQWARTVTASKTKELVDKLRAREIHLLSNWCHMTSQHSSFPSVWVRHWMSSERIHKDDTLTSRTEITIPQIVELLDFCLNTTYFIYDSEYYQQTHDAAMGSPISPLVTSYQVIATWNNVIN